MEVSRRGFIGGALATSGAAALLVDPPGATGSVAAVRETVRRGRAIAVRGRRVVVAHDQRRTIAVGSRLVDVGGEPVDVAISPDGRLAAVTTAFWDAPGLAIVDLARARLLKRLPAGNAPTGVAFAGAAIVVGGGEQQGRVFIVDPRRLEVVKQRPIGLCPRSVVPAPGREAAWIVLGASDAVVRVSTRNGRVERSVKTPPNPDRLAISPDGQRLLISHAGRDAGRVTELDLKTERVRRHAVGGLPTAVAWSPSGRRLVAVSGAVVTLGGGRQRVGGAPRGLAVSGRRAWTVDGLTGEVDQVRA